MRFEVPVIRDTYTEITQSDPPVWQFYWKEDSTYCHAKPVGCWRDDKGEWIRAHTNVSRSTGRQYEIDALWDEQLQEWVVKSKKVIGA